MAKINNKPASAYAKPHTMSGKAVSGGLKTESDKSYIDSLKPSAGNVSKGNTDKGVKTDGIKIRGTGAATKGVMARGPMA